MGDFNIDLIKVDMQNQTKDFVHSLYANAFYPTISKPVAEHSATILLDTVWNLGCCITTYLIISQCLTYFK